jgi:hypothetical protein
MSGWTRLQPALCRVAAVSGYRLLGRSNGACKYTPKGLGVRNTQSAVLALLSKNLQQKQNGLWSEVEPLRTMSTVNQSTGSGAIEKLLLITSLNK